MYICEPSMCAMCVCVCELCKLSPLVPANFPVQLALYGHWQTAVLGGCCS